MDILKNKMNNLNKEDQTLFLKGVFELILNKDNNKVLDLSDEEFKTLKEDIITKLLLLELDEDKFEKLKSSFLKTN